ncbi:MAG: glycosyltransferase family 2 protein [Clostridiales bacterium]|nr:glycosyltransferase family 2 protein [Clostridiales bacterium]
MTLGLSMIVKNESEVLSRVLDGIKDVVDEIVIVDTGSTDNTVEIARRYTDKVYSFDWINDFSAARNFALSKLTTDYWIWLDADDVIPQNTAVAIKRLMNKKALTADIVMLPYVAAVDDNGKPTFSYYRERIIRNTPRYFWQGAVHEAVELIGNVITLNKSIVHAKPTDRINGTRNLDIYEGLIASGRALSPRERYYYARELFYNGRTADAARELSQFIEGDGGFAANKADACLMLCDCFCVLNDKQAAMQAALYRFAFTPPDGEGCCKLGALFFERGDYKSAAKWYDVALHCKPDMTSGAFVQADYYGIIPLVWLTVCYDRLGETKKAYGYHRRAKKLRPTDKSIIANDAYFSAKGFSNL